jgi:glycosyltransferase involved in cell wall biosynthesis
MAKLRNSHNPKLIYITPSDDELHWLYANASGLLYPSKSEGFGLPLVEAAAAGIPIVCSDIPVFHEIATEYATYVRIDCSRHLADDISAWWAAAQAGNIPDSSRLPKLTWEQSAEQLLEVILKAAAGKVMK